MLPDAAQTLGGIHVTVSPPSREPLTQEFNLKNHRPVSQGK